MVLLAGLTIAGEGLLVDVRAVTGAAGDTCPWRTPSYAMFPGPFCRASKFRVDELAGGWEEEEFEASMAAGGCYLSLILDRKY